MAKICKRAVQYFLMATLSLIFLFPVLWTIISSFKTEQNVVAFPPQIFPNPFIIDNYIDVLTRFPYINWMINSIVITSSSVLLVLVLSSLAAYPMARLEFRFKKLIFTLIIAMMLIPIQGYMIPLFLMLSAVGLRSTPELSQLSLVLTAGANITSLFILTSFFKDIPLSLEEASHIDGCSPFRFFVGILLPLSKPALSSVAILTFIINWNQFMWPSILLTGARYLTLPVGIARHFSAAGHDASFSYGPALAAACMAIVPTMIVFLALQKHFVEGIASSGIKG